MLHRYKYMPIYYYVVTISVTIMSALYKSKHLNRPVILKWLKQSDSLVNQSLDFTRKHYNSNEPIFRSININGNDDDRKIMDQVYERCVQCDASTVALDASTNQIISVNLQEIKNCDKRATVDKVFSSKSNTAKPSTLFEVYKNIVVTLTKEIDLPGRYPDAHNIAEHTFSSTHPEWLNQGITTMALDFFHRYMWKELKFDLAYGICSSHYTARLLEKSGYKPVWNIRYDQLMDKEQRLFKVDPPHESITCQLIELPKYVN